MQLAQGLTVADVGAGTGYFEGRLSRAVGATGKVLALELDPALVHHMRARFAREALANVEVRLVTSHDMGLAANSVDRVLLVDVWHHMERRVAWAAQLRASMKAGARLVLVDALPSAAVGPPPLMRVSPEAVVAELSQAGFTAALVQVLPLHFIVVGEPLAAVR